MTTQTTKIQSAKLHAMDIVSQTELAFSHKLPLAIGASIGALVPVGTFTVGHYEITDAGWISIPGAIVAGGLMFSAITVYKWGERAFASGAKALGFVVLSEGIMSFSHTPWLSILMLTMLVLVNAIANGANLAMQYVETQATNAQAQPDVSVVSVPTALVTTHAAPTTPAPIPTTAPTRILNPIPTPIAITSSNPIATPEVDAPIYPTDRRWTPVGKTRSVPTPRARLRINRLPTADLN